MQFFIILSALLAVAKGGVVEKCSGIEIHGINHEKEVIKGDLMSPFQLAIDYDTSYLFFSQNVPLTDDFTSDKFRSSYINLKTNECGNIPGILGGFANAVDRKHHIVYLGGYDGIYKFDFSTKQAVFLGERDTSLWQLFFKDKLYFTTYPDDKAFIFENGVGTFIQELRRTKVRLLAVDRNDNFIFANTSGLYTLKKDTSKIAFLGDYKDVNAFTADVNQNIYFTTPQGIYYIDENRLEVKNLARINENVFGVAVEADNSIIYANENSIIRLKPTAEKCLSENNSKQH